MTGLSPSSRRAWIEILAFRPPPQALRVALLAEGVDRNLTVEYKHEYVKKSPSSRRAWIEIPRLRRPPWCSGVALLAEGVDRNKNRVQNLHS